MSRTPFVEVFSWTNGAAHHDAPLIGERGATRGRGAMEGGDEQGVVKSADLSELQAPRTPAANDVTMNAHARWPSGRRGMTYAMSGVVWRGVIRRAPTLWQPRSRSALWDWMCASRPNVVRLRPRQRCTAHRRRAAARGRTASGLWR